MAKVLIEQQQAHALQRLTGRRYLGEHIDAIGVVLDESLQATDLTLNPAQPRQHLGLVVVIAGRHYMHVTSIPLGGITRKRLNASLAALREMGVALLKKRRNALLRIGRHGRRCHQIDSELICPILRQADLLVETLLAHRL